jgi:hypothetical protein
MKVMSGEREKKSVGHDAVREERLLPSLMHLLNGV